jgi:hypothetical protein
MGGGGSESSSKTKQKSRTNVVNQSDLNLLNSSINNTIVNTVVRNVQSCSAKAISRQDLVVANVHTTGDIVIDTTQKQTTYLDFKCAQSSDVRNEVIAGLTNQIMADIQNSYDNNVLSQFDAIANSKSKNEFGSGGLFGGDSKSDSSTDQDSKIDINNSSYTNLQNIVENNVAANFTNENFANCLAKVASTQTTILKDISGRSFKFTSNQEQAIQLYSQCIQASGVSNQITSTLTNLLDMKVRMDVKNTATTTQTAKAESESVGGGLFQGIGEGLAKPIEALLSPLNNLLSGLGLGALSGALTPLLGVAGASSICCCIIIIIILIFQFMF